MDHVNMITTANGRTLAPSDLSRSQNNSTVVASINANAIFKRVHSVNVTQIQRV